MKSLILKLSKNAKGPLLLWGAAMLANVGNWLFNLQAGRQLSVEQFSVLSVYISLQYLISVPAFALQSTVSRFTAFYGAQGEQDKHFYFFRQYWWLAWMLGIGSFLLLLFFQNVVSNFFYINASFLTFTFALLLIPTFLVAFERGALLGNLAFVWVGVLMVVESLTKLLFFTNSHIFPFAPLTMAVVALPVAVSVAWFVSLIIARSFHPLPKNVNISKKSKQIVETYRYLSNSFLASLGVVLIYSLDVLLVNHYFEGETAGVYSMLSLLGKILYFTVTSLIGILIPVTARNLAKNITTKKPLYVLLGVIGVIGGLIVSTYLLIPQTVVQFFLREKGLQILPYLPRYAIAMYLLTLVTCVSSFNLARKNYFISRLIIFFALLQSLLIMLFHSTLHQVVGIVFYSLVSLSVITFIVEVFNVSFNSLKLSVFPFVDLLFKVDEGAKVRIKKSILIFNWKDVKHVHAGGAEVYVQEIAKKLVNRGFEVILFTSNDGHCKNEEMVDGVNITRRGGFVTVYIWAFLYSIFRFRKRVNVVIDSENGIPFFTPLFYSKPVILLIHHLHQDIFFQVLVPPFSWIANLLESFVMPFVYKKGTTVAVSKSTANELYKAVGIKVSKIIYNGVHHQEKQSNLIKSTKPLITYVGRLRKYKNIDTLIMAFEKIQRSYPEARLVIAGDGPDRSRLERLSFRNKLKQQIEFLGKISEKAKIELYKKAWVMIQPSSKEGWGITCIEANSFYTPVIAANVSGLNESVKNNINGWLFECGDVDDLTRKLDLILGDAKVRHALSLSSFTYSKQFSWDRQSKKFVKLIETILDQKRELEARKMRFQLPSLPVIKILRSGSI